MPPEGEIEKPKRDVSKSRAEIAALQKKLQATLLRKSGGNTQPGKKRIASKE
jgi:hypothetical protein